jgi:hypothetical protein
MPQKPLKQWGFWPVFGSRDFAGLVCWWQKTPEMAQVDLWLQDF